MLITIRDSSVCYVLRMVGWSKKAGNLRKTFLPNNGVTMNLVAVTDVPAPFNIAS